MPIARNSLRSMLLAAGLLGVALVALLQANRAANDRAVAAETAADFDYLVAWAQLVHDLETEHLVLSLAQLGLADGEASQIAANQRVRTEGETLASLDRLSNQAYDVSPLAEFVASELRELRAEDLVPPENYEAVAQELWTVDRWGLRDEPDALLDIYVAYQLPTLIGYDRVLAVALENWDELSPRTRSWFAAAPAALAAGFEGWIDDQAEPFLPFVDLRARLDATLPGVRTELQSIMESDDFQLLVESDAWIDTWDEHGGAQPPVPFESAIEASTNVRSAMFNLATDTAIQGGLDADNRHDDLGRRMWLWVAAALLAGGLCVAAVVARFVLLDRQARRWRRDANTDSLTGLANGRALDRRANQLLSQPCDGADALVVVDLDRFKIVNDTHGHLVGDALLRKVADRLVAEVTEWTAEKGRREHDSLITRLGGDEFVIVLHDLDDLMQATELAERLRAAVGRPARHGSRQVAVTLSAGVSFATGATTLIDLRTEADIALAQAKQLGGNLVQVFDDPIVRSIVQALNRGDDGSNIQAHVQAIYHSDGTYDYEALARWITEDGEAIAAGRWWLPGQQFDQSRMLLEAMVRHIPTIFAADPQFSGRIWLNVGPNDVNGRGDADFILNLLAEAEIEPTRCGIELLETAPIIDLSTTAQNLERLRRSGLHIALDDFGAGFTPLGHLVRLPIDSVKLDRSVVSGVDHNADQAALVAAVVQAADSLGLSVVAEGIEYQSELERLRDLGVRRLQGYLLHRPSPIAELPPAFDLTTTKTSPPDRITQ